MRALLVLMFLTAPVWADDVIVCDPSNPTVANSVTSYQKSVDSTGVPSANGYLVWMAPHNLMTTAQVAKLNMLQSQIDSLKGIPSRHWKCFDVDSNGTLDGVKEMTQAEKALIDAPMLAVQLRSAKIDTEKSTNEICNAEPSDLEARIDAAYADATTASQIKGVTVAIMKKLARCVWARTTSN